MNYQTIPKRDWRGWIWNRISERIPKLNRKNATILYLVGPEDLDRPVAIGKGFSSDNLIAVDLDEKCVQNVRKNGNLAICCRLEDLVSVLPQDFPIDVVLADFTCGLNNKTAKAFIMSMYISRAIKLGETIIAINLQRGRDSDSNPLRTAVSNVRQSTKYKNLIQTMTKNNDELENLIKIVTDPLHRGKQLFSMFSFHCRNSLPKYIANSFEYPDMFMKATKPEFFSYRQTIKTPYMDSVIFTMPHGLHGEYNEMLKIYSEEVKRDPLELKGKIAALKALRTMKAK